MAQFVTRSDIPYAAGSDFKPASGIRVDVPTAGYYRHRMVKGGHPVGVRIWHGPPLDPITREELDRSWRWQATVNNKDIDIDRVWPRVAGSPIDQAEHDHLAAMNSWAAEHAPEHSAADPMKPVDLLNAPIGF